MTSGNASAFPYVLSELSIEHGEGITVRDYFAAAALSAVASKDPATINYAQVAEIAYEIADAMLVRRIS